MNNIAFQDDPEEIDSSHQGTPIPNAAATNGSSTKTKESDQIGDGTVRMKRQIGLFGGIAMIIGTMIGSGIFISPTGVFHRSGQSVALSLMVWVGCGLLATLSAITYIELGTVVPRSGGEHAYFMAAFQPMHKFWGEVPAYLYAWMTATLRKPFSQAILGLSFGQYTLLPIINALGICDGWNEHIEYKTAHKLLAVVCVCVVAFVNIMSAKISARVQIFFTFAKLFAASIVIGIGIYNLSVGELGSLPTNGFDATDADYGSIALAFYFGLWSYDGWNNLNFLTEELINPNRNLPLAILIGIPLATVLYTFMNVSYFTVLSKSEFSGAVGIKFADRMLGGASFVMPILVAMSVFGTANGSQYSASRVSYVAARDGHLVGILSYVHVTRLTPVIAVMFNATLAIIFITFNDMTKLIDSFSITAWIFYSLSLISFFILRWKQPNAVRPFRVPWIIPAIALVISGYLIVAPIVDKPSTAHLYPVIFSIIGLLLYYPFVYKKKQLKCMGYIIAEAISAIRSELKVKKDWCTRVKPVRFIGNVEGMICAEVCLYIATALAHGKAFPEEISVAALGRFRTAMREVLGLEGQFVG